MESEDEGSLTYGNKLFGMRFCIPTKKAICAKLSHCVHLTYFGAVFIEGHGIYATAGGAMFLLVILNFFIHFE